MAGYALAFDIGNRRIGVALASTIARLPAPLTVIDRQKTDDVFEEVVNLVHQYEAEVVIVGLPRGLSGQETEQTKSAREFATELSARLSVPVAMQDEAVTSVEAERRLQERGKPYDKGDIDAEAAAIILDDYLKTSYGRTA